MEKSVQNSVQLYRWKKHLMFKQCNDFYTKLGEFDETLLILTIYSLVKPLKWLESKNWLIQDYELGTT